MMAGRRKHGTVPDPNIAVTSDGRPRCTRSDGRKWRCANPALPPSTRCEKHLFTPHKKPQKPEPSSQKSLSTIPTCPNPISSIPPPRKIKSEQNPLFLTQNPNSPKPSNRKQNPSRPSSQIPPSTIPFKGIKFSAPQREQSTETSSDEETLDEEEETESDVNVKGEGEESSGDYETESDDYEEDDVARKRVFGSGSGKLFIGSSQHKSKRDEHFSESGFIGSSHKLQRFSSPEVAIQNPKGVDVSDSKKNIIVSSVGFEPPRRTKKKVAP